MSAEVSDPYGGVWVPPETAYASAPVALCVVGRNMRCLAANQRLADIFRVPIERIVAQPIQMLLPGAAELVARGLARADAGQAIADREFPLPGTDHTYLITAQPFRDASGAIVGLSIAMFDITERKRMARELQEMERRSSFALQQAGQWIWELNIPTQAVRRSPHWKTVLGYRIDETVASDDSVAWSIVHPDDRHIAIGQLDKVLAGQTDVFDAVYRVRHRDGRWLWILSRGRVVEYDAKGDGVRLLATSVDITQQKKIEEELSATVRQREALERELVEANQRLTTLSEIDSLTELPNRRKFDDILRREIRRSSRHPPSLCLMMIDVDYFKDYNDINGHPEGDECLHRIAATLRLTLRRAGDVIARYGGEEFAAVLPETSEADALLMAERMLAAIASLEIANAGSPFGIVTISIGVAVVEADPTALPTPEAFVRSADRALYTAKQVGRNSIAVCDAQAPGGIRVLSISR